VFHLKGLPTPPNNPVLVFWYNSEVSVFYHKLFLVKD